MTADSDSVELLRIGLSQVSVLDFARRDELIWRAPLLLCLAGPQREDLLARASARVVAAAQAVCLEDQRPEHLFLLLDGSVSLSAAGVDIQVLSKGDFFGLASLFNDALRPCAQAGPDGARLALLDPAALSGLIRSSPEVGRVLARAAQERKSRASECADFLDLW